MYELTSALPSWAPYAATGTGSAVLAAAAVWAASRRRRTAAGPEARRTSRGDLTAAAIATAVSAEGMWETFSALDMPIWLRAVTFAFIEINVIQCARRARRTMQQKLAKIAAGETWQKATSGVDGIAMWLLTCLSAVLSVAHELTVPNPNAAVVLVRLVAPLIAAWGWERHMALERHLRGVASGVNWRITPERILVRLGLADPSARTTADVDAHRRLTALTRAAKKARRLDDTRAAKWRQRRAMARVDRLYEEADEHAHLSGDTDLQQQLLAQVGALYNTRSLVRLTAQPWWADDDTDTEPPAGDEEPGTVAVTDRTADDVLSWFRRRREARRDGIRPAPDPSPTDQVPSPSSRSKVWPSGPIQVRGPPPPPPKGPGPADPDLPAPRSRTRPRRTGPTPQPRTQAGPTNRSRTRPRPQTWTRRPPRPGPVRAGPARRPTLWTASTRPSPQTRRTSPTTAATSPRRNSPAPSL